MKFAFFIATTITVIGVSACSPSSPSIAATGGKSEQAPVQSSSSGNENTTVLPAKFEVKDFVMEKKFLPLDGSSTCKGRGTLISKDSRLSNGVYMVWISAKRWIDDDNRWTSFVIMDDGVATLQTYDYIGRGEDVKNFKYHDWKIIGYTKLNPGQIINQS